MDPASKTLESAQYVHPPVFRRTLEIFSEIPDNQYQELTPSWLDKTQSDYPTRKSNKLWEFTIITKEGEPRPHGKLFISPLQELFNSKGQLVRQLESKNNRLIFTLHREDDNAHTFRDLWQQVEKWVPMWQEHFRIQAFKGMTLTYEDLISKSTTPDLILENGDVEIGKYLAYFGIIPGRYKKAVHPFHNEVTVSVDATNHWQFRYAVRSTGATKTGETGVTVVFEVKTYDSSKRLDIKQCLSEIDQGHKLILEQFEAFFTDDAKLAFK